MTVKELRTLVDNLDEYIHVPGGIERLKKTVLHLAVSGQLVPQDPAEGTGEELYKQIQAEKQKLIAEGKLKKQKPLPAITEGENPFAIPETWKWARLGEVSLFIDYRGKTPRKTAYGVRLITAKNIRKGFIKEDPEEYIAESNYETWMTRGLPQNGDVLFTTEAPLANAATFNFHEPIALAQRVITLHPFSFEGDFLTKAINSPLMQDYIFSKATGTTVSGIKASKFKEVGIPLPPRSEQRRIVKKVDAIFMLIDKLAEKYSAEQAEREKLVASSLAQLSRGDGDLALTYLAEIIRTKADAAQLRKTILHLAVSGQLVPQDSSEGTGEELYRQIQTEKTKLVAEGKLKKQKPLPEITEDGIPFETPKSWVLIRTGDVCSVISGTSYSKNDLIHSGLRILRGGNVCDGGSVRLRDDDVIISKSLEDAEKKVRLGDVVIVASTGSMMAIGKPCLVDKKIDAQIGAFLRILRPNPAIKREYFWIYIRSDLYRTRIKRLVQGTNINNIKNEYVSHGEFPLPPLPEQIRIVQKATQLLNLVAQLENHLEK